MACVLEWRREAATYDTEEALVFTSLALALSLPQREAPPLWETPRAANRGADTLGDYSRRGQVGNQVPETPRPANGQEPPPLGPFAEATRAATQEGWESWGRRPGVPAGSLVYCMNIESIAARVTSRLGLSHPAHEAGHGKQNRKALHRKQEYHRPFPEPSAGERFGRRVQTDEQKDPTEH